MNEEVLLSKIKETVSKHSGVQGFFNQYFVKTGKVPKKLAQIYNDLFERRQEGDYVDLVTFEEVQVRPWLPEAKAFVEHVADFIEHLHK